MNFFSLCPGDQVRPSWVLFTTAEKANKRKRHSEGVPSTVYALLGSPAEEKMRLKPQYEPLRCKRCGRYDGAKIFEIGFDPDASIKIKGDFGYTTDRVFLISDKFLNTLKAGNVKGYEAKPIGNTGWHAIQVSLFVDSDDKVIKTAGIPCPECGRPEESWGVHRRLAELSLPKEINTFFTTKGGWPSAPFYDRETFLTEDVMSLLKESRIAGGYCYRLWTEDESRKYYENREKGIDKYPPGTTVYLTGSAPKHCNSARRP